MAAKGARPPSKADRAGLRNLDAARLLADYRTMWRIRAFEEAALKGLEQKLVLGAIHPSIGQEAVAVGVCSNLGPTDILLSTHRGHGHTIAKGADTLAMMRELFGREGGTCHGKGGSMHIADFKVGMLGANGVVGANILIAVGAAHAVRLKKGKEIVTCIFGDGAINRGPFLEGLNWAGVWKLPILFVCEDNGFAATTRTRAMTAGEGPAARAESFGIPAATVDGNDLLAVDETVRRLLGQSVLSFAPVAVEQFLTAYAAVSPAHWAKGLANDASREEIVNGIFSAVCAQPGMDALLLSSVAPRYWQLFADVAVLEAGAQEILASLASRYRLGLISNGYADTQRPRLHAARLTGYFQTIVVSDEVGWAKPDPRIFAYALEQLGIAPAFALYVGDSTSHDLAGALNAGLDFCLYRPAGGDGLELPPGVRLVTALSQLAGLRLTPDRCAG